jgi:molybdopterin converting factor small subunit
VSQPTKPVNKFFARLHRQTTEDGEVLEITCGADTLNGLNAAISDMGKAADKRMLEHNRWVMAAVAKEEQRLRGARMDVRDELTRMQLRIRETETQEDGADGTASGAPA